jgi:hypothetical protein
MRRGDEAGGSENLERRTRGRGELGKREEEKRES